MYVALAAVNGAAFLFYLTVIVFGVVLSLGKGRDG